MAIALIPFVELDLNLLPPFLPFPRLSSPAKKKKKKQVGLVLGRCGSKRALVVAVIPTPAVGVSEVGKR